MPICIYTRTRPVRTRRLSYTGIRPRAANQQITCHPKNTVKAWRLDAVCIQAIDSSNTIEYSQACFQHPPGQPRERRAYRRV